MLVVVSQGWRRRERHGPALLFAAAIALLGCDGDEGTDAGVAADAGGPLDAGDVSDAGPADDDAGARDAGLDASLDGATDAEAADGGPVCGARPTGPVSLESTMTLASRLVEFDLTSALARIDGGDGTVGDADGLYDAATGMTLLGTEVDVFPREERFQVGSLGFDDTGVHLGDLSLGFGEAVEGDRPSPAAAPEWAKRPHA